MPLQPPQLRREAASKRTFSSVQAISEASQRADFQPALPCSIPKSFFFRKSFFVQKEGRFAKRFILLYKEIGIFQDILP